MGVHWKIQFLGEFMKNQYIGGSCLKGGTSTVCKFKSGLGEKKEWCFWGGGGLISQCTLWVRWGHRDFEKWGEILVRRDGFETEGLIPLYRLW